ncbi:MAG: sensor histidine kinase [Actinobacteria bacterium]|nr:sensor histidine kinase [Actinomycetota bacterium]
MTARAGVRSVGTAAARTRAEDRAASALRTDLEAVWAISASEGPGAAVDAVLTFAGTILQRAAEADGPAPVAEAARLVALTSEITSTGDGATCRALFRIASRRLALVGRDPGATLASTLRLLVMVGPVTDASVWLANDSGRVELAAATSPTAATRRWRRAALDAVGRADVELPAPGSRVRVQAYPLGAREGAVVIRLSGDAVDVLPFLEEFALGFEGVVERDRLARATESNGDRLQQTYERRLKRAAFDLHDGPLQDLAALAGEVRLLRSQVLASDAMPHDVLGGRLDDVSGRIAELDRVLRGVMHSLETSTLAEGPVGACLEREADTFRRRTSAAIEVHVSGPVDDVSMSQRIASVRIVQEALSNIREHSGASEVTVLVRAEEHRLELVVSDNGAGFDVRETANAAARRGRLGIVGMSERVRLLGGVFSIDSAPGEGTTLTASIPAWRPI